MGNINNGVLDGVRRIGAKVRDLTIDGQIAGAPLGFRLRGATTSGHPTTGTWKTGDEVRDRAGAIWICTVGGSPGTWTGTVTALPPSGDTTGAADTAAFAAALARAGSNGVLQLLKGNYYACAPLLITQTGVSILGQGLGATTINIVTSFSDPASVTPGSFLAPAVFQVGNITTQANNCTIAGLTFNNLGTMGSSTAVSCINNGGSASLQADHLEFININGWGIEGYSGASGSHEIVRGMYSTLTFSGVAGAMHLNGQGYTINSMMSNIQLVGTNGTTTGPAANLDGIFLDNGFDMVGTNINTANSISASTAAGLHLGAFGVVWITGMDSGGAAATGLHLSGASSGVFSNGSFFGYGQGCVIEGTSTAVLTNMTFSNSNTNGMTVSSTATSGPVVLDNVNFGSYSNSGENGRSPGAGPVYDLNWTGSATGRVTNTIFGSQIQGTPGTANGVQQSVNIAASQQVAFEGVQFTGGSSSSSNWFTATPAVVSVLTGGTLKFFAGLAAASASSSPSNPAGTTSTSLVMAGLNTTYTPATTGKVLVIATGGWTTQTASAIGNIGARYGTGTPPANGAAVTGTRFGAVGDSQVKAGGIGSLLPYTFVQVLSLTAGTTYWFDIAFLTQTTGDEAYIENANMTFVELPG